MLARDAAELPRGAAAFRGSVESLLFDGANSAVLVREAATRARVPDCAAADRALRRPARGRAIAFGFDPARAVCFRATRSRWRLHDAATDTASHWRLALLLLLAPALLWLVGLIVLPHVELAVLSLRARVAPRVYELSLAQYRTFFDEPLYWHTFVRTAVMSIVATVAARC